MRQSDNGHEFLFPTPRHSRRFRPTVVGAVGEHVCAIGFCFWSVVVVLAWPTGVTTGDVHKKVTPLLEMHGCTLQPCVRGGARPYEIWPTHCSRRALIHHTISKVRVLLLASSHTTVRFVMCEIRWLLVTRLRFIVSVNSIGDRFCQNISKVEIFS